jgi:hypothetical protein
LNNKSFNGESSVAKIRTRFFIETHEVKIIRRRKFFIRAFCEECGREVSLLPPADAAFLVAEETAEIYSWIDSKKIHYFYLNGTVPFVCLTSVCLV